ncbi:MAG: tetratricopeptide repeat protein [Gemmatimonadota bacterium]
MTSSPELTPAYQRFFAELKRRRVFRVMAVYGAVGFVILQVVELMVPALLLPEWTYRLVALMLLVGFPVAIVLAWAFESTPDGVRRTDPAESGELEAIAAAPAAKRWPSGLLAVAGAAVLIGSVWLAGRRAGESASEPRSSRTADAGEIAAGTTGGAAGDDAVLQLAYADLSDDTRPSIAVLPFADMSREGDQAYFADGMTEELLNALAKIRELRVAGRTSSFQYRGQEKDLRQIGAELGVRYLVEGSIRKQDDRLRITAQLIDADDSFHLWSETYDRTLDDIFAIQEEISEAIAAALEVSLGLTGDESLVMPTADLGAYDLYLAAQARVRERGDGVKEAVRLYEAAVARDSGWAPAWAGLAQARALLPYYPDSVIGSEESRDGWKQSLDDAEAAARRALAIDPSNSGAEVALGNVIRDRRQWGDAEPHYLRALQIDPDNVEAHQQYAEYLAASGRLDEALRSARRGVDLDPTSSIRLLVLGYVLRVNGHLPQAIATLERAVEIDPSLLRAQFNLAGTYVSSGDFDQAERVLLEEIFPRLEASGRMTSEERATRSEQVRREMAALRGGDIEELEACCAPVSWGSYLKLGEEEKALDALAADARADVGFGTVRQSGMWVASWDGLRSDPRFREAARLMNLEGVEPRRAPPGS